MSKTVERDAVRLVSQWCQAIEEVVTLRVKGSVFGDLINGDVIGCSKISCHAQNTSYCYINRHIQTRLT
jgi:hypothetical protein